MDNFPSALLEFSGRKMNDRMYIRFWELVVCGVVSYA